MPLLIEGLLIVSALLILGDRLVVGFLLLLVGVLVAAWEVAATVAVVGFLVRLADTDVGGWTDGGLAGARAAPAGGEWLVSQVVDAADGAVLVVCGFFAAEDGVWDAAQEFFAVEGRCLDRSVDVGIGVWAVGGLAAGGGGWAAAHAAERWTAEATVRAMLVVL